MVSINLGTSVAPDWTPTAHATSHTVDWSLATKERATKDTGDWTTKAAGKRSCTIKTENLMSYDAEGGVVELRGMLKAGEEVELKYGYKTEASGDKYEKGIFLVTALSENTPGDGDATYSATFESTGAITTETVSGT